METLVKLWKMNGKRKGDLKKALIAAFVCSTLGISQMIAILAAIQVVMDEISLQQGLIEICICMLVCIIGNFIASYYEQIHALQSGMYMCADLRKSVANHLKKAPLLFFQKNTVEKIIATLTTTLQGVEMASTMSIVMVVSGLFNAVAMAIFMFFYEWKIAIVVVIGIICYLGVIHWQMKVSYATAPVRQKAQTDLSASSIVFSKGIRIIKAFCFPKGNEDIQNAIDESCQANLQLTDRSMPSQFAAHTSIAIFESILVALTIYFEFAIDKTILLLIFSYFAYASLNQAGSILSMMGMIESGLNEMEDIQKAPVMENNESENEIENSTIELSHVHFSYGNREILHDITTRFNQNTLTALIGPSGSGKTTMCRLIARFEDVDKGSIRIGGVDIKDIPYETLMEKISIVFQDVYLFEDTILNNIRFGKPDATLEEVRKVAKAARCDEFIMQLENGYDTVLQEGGNSLSGGEKQRISIARAMLKDAPIVILDEATSALDAENECAFFEAIEALIAKKTVIMIAHRMSTIERADQVVAIENGRVVQMGTPEELEKTPGLYNDFLASRKLAKGWSLQK